MSRLGFLVRDEHFAAGVEAIAELLRPAGAGGGGDLHPLRRLRRGRRGQRGLYAGAVCALYPGAGRPGGSRAGPLPSATAPTAAPWPGTRRCTWTWCGPALLCTAWGPTAARLGLRPVMTLKSSISTIKTFDPDTDISYGRTFHTTEQDPDRRAAHRLRGRAVPGPLQPDVGGDGRRARRPSRGRICMDMSMVDLTGLPDVQVGDAVELFGRRQSVERPGGHPGHHPLRADLRRQQAGCPGCTWKMAEWWSGACSCCCRRRAVSRRGCGVQAFCCKRKPWGGRALPGRPK